MKLYLCRFCKTRLDKYGELFLSITGLIQCQKCNNKYHYSELITIYNNIEYIDLTPHRTYSS